MDDFEKQNVFEEKTVQDVFYLIKNTFGNINDTNAKVVYYILKNTERKIEEAIRRIEERIEPLKGYPNITKESLTKLCFEDFLMIGSNMEIDGKTLSEEEKQKFVGKKIFDWIHTKRKWEKLLKTLQEDYLPLVSDIVNDLCETTIKCEITKPVHTVEIEPYLDNLATKGYLNLSTMEVTAKSLNAFACALKEELDRPLTNKDLLQFKKQGGETYSKISIRNAVEHANTK